ncbi:unnamed protein product [Macrosiphum euphorbiae]|uniref:Uncharacterized protein n=1 Tax=Macrosiphum euphorbiae TaxID=13131 RepID=A0AAV0XSF4_9HEMI|nr:unnamed protein product [Macrosiphum euphorbiae]
MQPVRQASNHLFVVGEGVNAISPTDPYLAGYITRIDGDDIFVKFPYGRLDPYEYKYRIDQVLPLQTQFPAGKFKPIKLTKRDKQVQRQKIKLYEERLQRHFTEK